MKTHLIHLENDDNVISIIEKLSWGKASRVLLVYPTSPDLRLQKLDLLLIKRAAQKQGFSLGIVSRSHDVKYLAAEGKIPVFRSIKHSQRKTWIADDSDIKVKVERKTAEEIRKQGHDAKIFESEWRNIFSVRLFFFTIGVLSVLFISLIFVPSANVKLIVPDQEHNITLAITADESIDEVNLSGTIPDRTLEIDVDGTRLVSINTKTNIPDKYSVGKIIFTNLTETQIEIPMGTIISRMDKTGIRFETIEKGEIPAGIGQTIEIPIRAITPGEAGNMDANSLGSLIGDLATSVSAINPEPSYGGTDLITNVASESDREELFILLEKDLKMKAIQAAQDQLGEENIIFPDTVMIGETKDVSYVPAPGQPGDRLSLALKLGYTMRYAAYSDLIRLGELSLKAGLPQGYIFSPGSSIQFKLLNGPTTDSNGKTTLRLQISQNIRREIDVMFIAGLVQGKPISDSYRILEEELGPDIKPVVDVSPSWWRWLPIVPLRIDIIY